MRKNVNRLIAFGIGISVMGGSVIPVFAADTTQQTVTTTAVSGQTVNGKPLLTLDEAIKGAIANSDTLAFEEKQINYQDKINDVTEKSDDFNNANDDKKDLDNDTSDVTLKQLKQQKDFDEDQLRFNVTKKYNDMVTSQMKIDKAAKDIEVKNKLLSDSKLKKSLGMLTSVDQTATELDIQNAQNTQNTSQNALKDAQHAFMVLTGKDVAQYSLDQNIKYDVFRIDGSVDEYLDNAIENYKKYNTELLKLKKDYFSDNKMPEIAEEPTGSKPTQNQDESDQDYQKRVDAYNNAITKYKTSLSDRLTYLNSKLGMYRDESVLNSTKKQLKESLRSSYSGLLSKEADINYKKQNIELNNKKLGDAKLKLDLGLMTKSDYDTLALASKQLEIELRSAVLDYNNAKEQIQQPWIALS